MTGHARIDDYLARLAGELDLPRRRRADVLAEAEDHLLCTVAELTRAGRSGIDAACEALARYGPLQDVARSYARARSHPATARLATGVVASVGSFAVLFAVTTQLPAVRAGIPATAVTSGAAGVVGWIAVQLAIACGALAVIRCWRLRCEPEGRAGTLRLANRSAAAAVAAVAISTIFDVAAFVRMPAGQGQHAALVFGLVLAAMATTAFALAQIFVAHRRLRRLERYGLEPASEDAFDDLRVASLAVVRALTALPAIGRAASAAQPRLCGAFAAGSPLARMLRSHPWRFGVACALITGLLAGGGHLVAEGPPTAGVAVALLVVLIIAAIEGAAVFGCYVLFGRFLGIRSPGSGRA